MNCPNCSATMTTMTLDAHLAAPVDIDLCTACQAFWFDKYESLKLSAGSTLKLIKLIGEHSTAGKPSLSSTLHCPRCSGRLLLTHDMQRSTRFSYWRCNAHGRFISFFDFLREKNFIRPLSAQQIEELRKNVQTINCSNCGAPIDLASGATCSHCGSPVAMLDMSQSQELLKQLAQAAEPKTINPAALALDLAKVKLDIDLLSGSHRPDALCSDASSSGLVEAGLNAVVRWLSKSGI